MNHRAEHILKLLAEKHGKDVFVPECKDGPTQAVSQYMRMDAWVMNRSWAHPCYTVYEIKVSRSDFLNDQKWRGYLPYCNQLYFVAQKGLISASELPPEAGLIELVGGPEGKRLVTRRKSAWRDVEIPEPLLRYVLMCRTTVQRNNFSRELTKEERRERWQEFVAAKAEDRKLGERVNRAIREKVRTVEDRNRQLERLMAEYDDVRTTLRELNIDPERSYLSWAVRDRVKDAQKLFDPKLLTAMESLKLSLERALSEAEKLQQEAEQTTAA